MRAGGVGEEPPTAPSGWPATSSAVSPRNSTGTGITCNTVTSP
ncbi:hypothetical protein ANO14919_138470 [Xylariales sp. No.14919]|nr:hypothetical protein ANO14919_138470 [Xylariales sp. No.14919]